MTDQDRVFLVAALSALALVAFATSLTLLVARARAQLRAPLAGALTFSLLCIAITSGIGAAAVVWESVELAIAAALVAGIATLSIARVGLLRREHGALVGGTAAVAEARAAARAALRALVAATRLAERLDGAASLDEIDALLSDAARRALPDAVVAIVPAEPAHDGPHVDVPLRTSDERALRAVWPAPPAHGREDLSAAEVVLRALASEASLGVARLDGRQAAEAEVRRRDVTAALGQRLRGADDAFGACHLAAQAAGTELGARSAAIEATGINATFTLDGDRGGEHQLVVPLDEGGQLTLSLSADPGASDRAVASGIGDALARALTVHAARRLADERSARQAAVAAAARSVHGPLDGMLRGVADAARAALEADAVVIYTLGPGGPIALEVVGTGLPQACDGVAAQAIATARSVVDPDGRFLAASPCELACGIAVPLPGGGERGAISALYRVRRPLTERDAEDLASFAQISALAIDRATLERELDRREVLRIGYLEITDALAGTREPAETYTAVASAARRGLRAAAAVVVTESDGLGLQATGSAPTVPALVDEAGQAGALLQLAAREGRIVLCADASSDRRVSGSERRRLLDAGQRSALCIPVVSPAGLTAVLGVVWSDAHAASDDDLDLARHLGAAAAAAIERAETLASERQARARAQEMQRIGGLMASNLDAAAVLREIVSQAALLLNADSCALRLVEGDRLVVRAVQGEAAELLAGEQAPLTGGPTGEVLARRTPVAVADMAADDRFLPDDPLVQARFVAYLGAPILSPDGDLRGVLALYDRRRRVWKPDEVEALEAFANSATVALQNALLYQRVAQEKDKSEAIIASIADGIVVIDADSRIEMWNRATATMTGVSSRVALRRTLRELLRGELGDHDDAALAALQEAADSGGGVDVRLARGEREIWLQARAAELRDPVADRIGTVYALRDVSEDRQLDQLKSDFVATVSHELRTPLTSIYGFAETLLRGDVSFADEDRKTFLGYIASESERLTRLVDGLLSVTRLEAGGVELALEDIDVGDVLREIVVRQAERAKDSHRVELHLPARPLVAAADRDKLRQVVLNLVDNAIKYSPDGGTVDVTATRQLDMVEIRVRDHGIGISAADQRNLFRKFFRADARMTRGIRGIGLGLYLTRGFVTAMGGRIRVESEAGKGSTFIVDLPLRRSSGGGVRAA